MDKETTIHQLKDKIKKFCEDRDWDQYHGAKDLAVALITEASELLSHFRFKSESEIDEIFKDDKKKSKIEEEISDVLYFILRLSQKYHIDLSSALEKKMKINEEKYPIEKSKGKNIKYTDL